MFMKAKLKAAHALSQFDNEIAGAVATFLVTHLDDDIHYHQDKQTFINGASGVIHLLGDQKYGRSGQYIRKIVALYPEELLEPAVETLRWHVSHPRKAEELAKLVEKHPHLLKSVVSFMTSQDSPEDGRLSALLHLGMVAKTPEDKQAVFMAFYNKGANGQSAKGDSPYLTAAADYFYEHPVDLAATVRALPKASLSQANLDEFIHKIDAAQDRMLPFQDAVASKRITAHNRAELRAILVPLKSLKETFENLDLQLSPLGGSSPRLMDTWQFVADEIRQKYKGRVPQQQQYGFHKEIRLEG